MANIRDYAEFYEEPRESNSTILKRFISKYKVSFYMNEREHVCCDVKFLREVYTSDRLLFDALVIELLLRGVNIHVRSGGSLFYTPVSQPFHILRSTTETRKYMNIHFSGNIGSILKQLEVNNDSFFDGIIIENFGILFPNNYNFEELELLFKNQNFKIEINDSGDDEISHMFKFPVIVDTLHANNVFSLAKLRKLSSGQLETILHSKGIGEKKQALILEAMEQSASSSKTINKGSEEPDVPIVYPQIIAEHVETRKMFEECDHKFKTIPINADRVMVEQQLKNMGVQSGGKKGNETIDDILESKERYLNYIDSLNGIQVFQPLLSDFWERANIELDSFNIPDHANLCFDNEHHQGTEEILSELGYVQIMLDEALNNFELSLSTALDEKAGWLEIFKKSLDAKNPLTLQEIGDSLGLTRERVRQIEIQITKKCESISADFNLKAKIYAELFKSHVFVPIAHISSEYLRVLRISGTPLKTIFFIDPKASEEQKKRLKQLREFFENKDELSLRDATEVVNSELRENFSELDITNLLRELGYDYHLESVYYRHKVSRNDLICFLLKNHFPDGIKLDSEGIEKMQNVGKAVSGSFVFDPDVMNHRSIDGAFRRLVEQGIATPIGRQTYMLLENSNLSEDLLNKIFLYLVSILKVHSEARNSGLCDHFRDELTSQSVSDYEVYYKLKSAYADQFDFGRGNTMTIRNRNTKKISTDRLLVNFVTAHDGAVSKDVISKELGLKQYTVEQTISNSEDLVAGKGIVSIAPKHLNGQLSDFLVGEMDKQLAVKKGYLFPEKVRRNLMMHPELFDFLPDTVYLTNLNLFSALLKGAKTQLKGFPQLLYVEANISPLELVRDEFGNNLFTKDDLYNFFEDVGYADSSINSKMGRMVNDNDISEIRSGLFLITENLVFSDSDLAMIHSYIENGFNKENQYLKLTDLRINPSLLHKLDFDLTWNYYVLAIAVDQMPDYRNLLWNNGVYEGQSLPVNPYIVVKENSNFKNLLDLIDYEIARYHGSMSEPEIYAFLLQRGILSNEKRRNLPDYVFNNLFQRNELGDLSIKGK